MNMDSYVHSSFIIKTRAANNWELRLGEMGRNG
ncbi:hypothetical protein A8990_12959 [Paenibacillus taihuensis]|uniref:Uncharacterized protein n=1 Tax=Paenibacillus taihuensis TaxID=1156355 RepID=A0A3D9R3H6_9BACL|nr:hypothetical protein A8990_12959 [Paenibacillus taihuensis]